ncbi:Homeobox protein KNOX3 [Hordeum vulgare]|nr:Homeobox protein KNOX3 [Hordeum vulgare]
MAQRYPGDGAAANGFGRRHLHESEGRLLYEADYTAPPDMRVLGLWRMSANGVPVPPLPSRADRCAKIVSIQSSLPGSSRKQSRYAFDNNTLWTAYFERRHANQFAATNGDDLGDCATTASSSTRAAPAPTSSSQRPSWRCSPSSRSTWTWLPTTRPPSNGRGTTTSGRR